MGFFFFFLELYVISTTPDYIMDAFFGRKKNPFSHIQKKKNDDDDDDDNDDDSIIPRISQRIYFFV